MLVGWTSFWDLKTEKVNKLLVMILCTSQMHRGFQKIHVQCRFYCMHIIEEVYTVCKFMILRACLILNEGF